MPVKRCSAARAVSMLFPLQCFQIVSDCFDYLIRNAERLRTFNDAFIDVFRVNWIIFFYVFQ